MDSAAVHCTSSCVAANMAAVLCWLGAQVVKETTARSAAIVVLVVARCRLPLSPLVCSVVDVVSEKPQLYCCQQLH